VIETGAVIANGNGIVIVTGIATAKMGVTIATGGIVGMEIGIGIGTRTGVAIEEITTGGEVVENGVGVITGIGSVSTMGVSALFKSRA
jgi:hypothetical protein